ncbi:MAG TPA: molybdopterin-dependent oxidoreductase, partial [Candidatus Binatia bacterium]|nr:molybdopterin-dependent oxidoreductase [Candidatus Binatia bacterium]
KIEPGRFPLPEYDGRVCAMGMARLEQQYHKDRLRYPLRRVGERGRGRWQRISWDEAFDWLASFCRETRKNPTVGISLSPWEMILSVLSRKWVAKEWGGVRWSTQWRRGKPHYAQACGVKVSETAHWVTPLVGGVFAFGSTGGRWS